LNHIFKSVNYEDFELDADLKINELQSKDDFIPGPQLITREKLRFITQIEQSNPIKNTFICQHLETKALYLLKEFEKTK